MSSSFFRGPNEDDLIIVEANNNTTANLDTVNSEADAKIDAAADKDEAAGVVPGKAVADTLEAAAGLPDGAAIERDDKANDDTDAATKSKEQVGNGIS